MTLAIMPNHPIMRNFVPMVLNCGLAACLSACVTPPAPVSPVPVGDGVYTTGSAGSSGAAYGGGIEDERYQQAIKFCFDQGKQLVRVDASDRNGRPWETPSGEIRFRCVGRGEPGWKEPAG